ncbi:Transcription repressor OFP8 [Sesamum alatum]|uniref:Transcription repressor n=1 Tax=Sesamum alatum TaxID=300844 RepID=A0AAE1YIU4_9LAMI|nr:Transcription repressor OFP8 [Sesamum alatum]
MAENRLKIRICRIFRSPLGSCKSKDQISDVIETHHNRQHYQLVELFSPQPRSPFSFPPLMAEKSYFLRRNLHFLSSDLDGRKCPPASPIISPLNTLYGIPNEKKKHRKPINKKKGRSIAYKKKYSGFTEFPECKYNVLFSSDEEKEEDDRASFLPSTGERRRTAAEPVVQDSLAVVKRSSDPYGDFRTSMVEMIVEKQMFEAKDLENLLHCFLSLNSNHHHKVIIQVFSEIWEALLL